jgi:hypothetical protein
VFYTDQIGQIRLETLGLPIMTTVALIDCVRMIFLHQFLTDSFYALTATCNPALTSSR